MAGESLLDEILVGGGVVAAAVGAYLPWLKTNPDLPSNAEIPMIYYSGMSSGFEAFNFVLLGATGLVLLIRGVSTRPQVQTGMTLLAGVGFVMYPVYYLSHSTLFGFSATFVPALGWYLTVLGGALFFVAGGLLLPSVVRRPKAIATSKE